MKKLYVLLFFFSLLVGADAMAQTIRYVKPNGSGDGSSWASASGDLQGMINVSAANDEVWVAAGMYKPTENLSTTGASTSNRDKAFVLKSGVKIYGGFSGAETQLAQRDFTINVTILSGDLNNDNKASDGDCYHVVSSRNATAGIAVLDGFTIQHGFANGSGGITENAVEITRNTGGAIATRGTNTQATYQNLIIKENSAISHGGAVYIRTGGTAQVYSFINVRFENNTSTGGAGGAVYAYPSINSPITTFTNCYFLNNAAATTGGAVHHTGTVASSAINFIESRFEGNKATTSGGHFYNAAASASVIKSTFSGGSSTVNGGAIYFVGNNINISESRFTGNKATGNSGAIYLGTSTSTTSVIEKCSFEANESTTTAGAIYFYCNSTALRGNRFYSNKATTNGGALFIFGLGTAISSPEISNNIFYNNTSLSASSPTAIAGGGAIFVSSNTAPTIINTTFYNNKATNKGGALLVGYSSSMVKVYNSIFFANTATDAASLDLSNFSTGNLTMAHTSTQLYGVTGVDGNLVGLDPDFESTDVNNAKFLQLKESSFLINAGSNDFLPVDLTTDLLGSNRVTHNVVDFGAIEYTGPWPEPKTAYINENSPVGTFAAKPETRLTGTITWSFFSGNTNNAFAVDPATGNISVANSAALDYETKNLFSLNLKAINTLGQFQYVPVLVYLNNLMEDPGTPQVTNVRVNGVIISYRPKLAGKAEPLSDVTIFVDDVAVAAKARTDAQGNWAITFDENVKEGTRSFHVITTNELGTSNPSAKVSATFKLYSGQVIPNNLLTPNGDGKNDLWFVKDLDAMYPKNQVVVYDKAGKIVFSKSNYQSDWDGTYNGSVLNTGTYYYEINIGAGLKPIKGTLTILQGR